MKRRYRIRYVDGTTSIPASRKSVYALCDDLELAGEAARIHCVEVEREGACISTVGDSMNRKIFDAFDSFHQADRSARRLADLADRGDVVAKAILARRARLGRYAAVASATGRFATGTVPSSLRTKLARLAEDRAAFDRAHRRTDA